MKLHILNDRPFHSETFSSVIATAERLGVGYQIHLAGLAKEMSRAYLPSRDVLRHDVVGSVMPHLDRDDVLFCVSVGPHAPRRFKALKKASNRVVGIEHDPYSHGAAWVDRIKLTDVKDNPWEMLYYQVEEISDFQPRIDIKQKLPERFVLHVGRPRRIVTTATVTTIAAVNDHVDLPIVFLGGRPDGKKTSRRLRQFGHAVRLHGVPDRPLAEIAKRAEAILFTASIDGAKEEKKPGSLYLRKISGSFTMATMHGKPLIAAKAFFDGRYTNGIDLLDNPDLSDENLARKAAAADEDRRRMIEHNTKFFEELLS